MQAVYGEIRVQSEDLVEVAEFGQRYEAGIRQAHWSVGVFLHQAYGSVNGFPWQVDNLK